MKSSGPWEALPQTKLVELIEFQLSYFKLQKMMLLKCCTQYASKFGKLSSGHRTGKGQLSFQSQRKEMPNNVQTTAQLHSFHMLARSCSKSFKLGFKQYVNREHSDIKAGFRKGRGTRDQISNIRWIIRKATEFQKKKSTSALLITPKPLTVYIKTNCEKFFKRWKYQTI